jgi:hypothetical protein
MVRVAKLGVQFLLPFQKSVGYVLEEQQAERDVLVDGGVQVGAQLVGRGPELFFKIVEELLFGLAHGFFTGAGCADGSRSG